jgi:hypothetical protein
MKRLSGRAWAVILLVAVGTLISGSWLLGQGSQPGYSVNMPVSLGVGQVRTPQFEVKNGNYSIAIEAKKRLPLDDMNCMLGLTDPTPLVPCNRGKEPMIQANWTLWSHGQIADQGSSGTHKNDGEWENDGVVRVIGNFKGKKGTKYILEVNFTKDGAALAVTDPHLVVRVISETEQ